MRVPAALMYRSAGARHLLSRRESRKVKKEISPGLVGVVVAVLVVLIAGVGWYLMNRDTAPITGVGSDANVKAKQGNHLHTLGDGKSRK